MQISNLNPDLLVSIHCYAGDKQQVMDLLPAFEHHQAPIVVVSPVDSQVHGISMHICRCAGGVGYIGQVSWDRQYEQMKLLLDYPQQWFLMNDSDSFVVIPKLPDHLFEDKNTVWSNEVTDFRVPGQSWQGMPPWPMDYHKGYPLIAMQPPYFMHRNALEKIVKHAKGLKACPTTPFIDWWFVPACYAAGVKHRRYNRGASCENVTPLGKAVMRECVKDRQAQFLHSIKTKEVCDDLLKLYKDTYGS